MINSIQSPILWSVLYFRGWSDDINADLAVTDYILYVLESVTVCFISLKKCYCFLFLIFLVRGRDFKSIHLIYPSTIARFLGLGINIRFSENYKYVNSKYAFRDKKGDDQACLQTQWIHCELDLGQNSYHCMPCPHSNRGSGASKSIPTMCLRIHVARTHSPECFPLSSVRSHEQKTRALSLGNCYYIH